jgi:RNA polymerase sigma-70 factor (ECF subfamily)
MTDPDDKVPRTEALVRAFQQGAELSFEQLYARLAPALYAWAVLRAPRGIEPADLLGETWLRAVRSVHDFDPARASFRAWLFGIAKKVLLHELRAQAQRERSAERTGDGSRATRGGLEGVPEAVTSLSLRFQREESMTRFLERIGGLAREERELVVYCGLEGSTCREAATRMGLSEEATFKRWQRLRAELRASSWAAELLE